MICTSRTPITAHRIRGRDKSAALLTLMVRLCSISCDLFHEFTHVSGRLRSQQDHPTQRARILGHHQLFQRKTGWPHGSTSTLAPRPGPRCFIPARYSAGSASHHSRESNVRRRGDCVVVGDEAAPCPSLRFNPVSHVNSFSIFGRPTKHSVLSHGPKAAFTFHDTILTARPTCMHAWMQIMRDRRGGRRSASLSYSQASVVVNELQAVLFLRPLVGHSGAAPGNTFLSVTTTTTFYHRSFSPTH
jgi:hypothetical protein